MCRHSKVRLWGPVGKLASHHGSPPFSWAWDPATSAAAVAAVNLGLGHAPANPSGSMVSKCPDTAPVYRKTQSTVGHTARCAHTFAAGSELCVYIHVSREDIPKN